MTDKAEGAPEARIPDTYCEHCNGTGYIGGLDCPKCGHGSAASPEERCDCEPGFACPVHAKGALFPEVRLTPKDLAGLSWAQAFAKAAAAIAERCAWHGCPNPPGAGSSVCPDHEV